MSNPLLEIQFRIPFDEILPEHVEPAIDALLDEARARQKQLAATEGPLTYDNTLGLLDRFTEKLDFASEVVQHIVFVATTPEFRAAHNAIQPKLSLFRSEIVLDPGLWRILKEYASSAEAQSLTGTRARFLKKTMDAFRREGAELDDAGKEKLKTIGIELAQLTTKYNENVLDATNAFEFIITDESALSGLPQQARDAARENAAAKAKQGWRFTLHAPSYHAVMTYLDDRAVRESLYRAYMTRATSGEWNNAPLIGRILELRRERARLLGYASFADLVLEDRMAHSAARARAFVDQLRDKTELRFRKEVDDLEKFAGKKLQPWDIAYYSEKYRAALYDFDEEALRPYYPLRRVVNGMFQLVERLYGIRVEEDHGAPVWDDAVKVYSIFDESGEKLGSFYADWFPRENKRGGAWMEAFITGGPTADGFRPHLGLVCGNLTPPVGNKPALLTHREVETVFHEFGHLLHHSLSRVEVRSLAGTNVPWDFVELPSQIMENWCWERESLDLLARHYETGEPIPDELFEKMKSAKTFMAASAQMRQVGFATLDLALHVNYNPETDGDVITYSRNLSQEFAPAPLPPDYGMIASFSHLFAGPVGYAAGYYSYKWAEVLDADAFTRFQAEGIFSRAVGAEFRSKILARGNSEEPADLFRSFMGRDPDMGALLRRSGLAA